MSFFHSSSFSVQIMLYKRSNWQRRYMKHFFLFVAEDNSFLFVAEDNSFLFVAEDNSFLFVAEDNSFSYHELGRTVIAELTVCV